MYVYARVCMRIKVSLNSSLTNLHFTRLISNMPWILFTVSLFHSVSECLCMFYMTYMLKIHQQGSKNGSSHKIYKGVRFSLITLNQLQVCINDDGASLTDVDIQSKVIQVFPRHVSTAFLCT